MTRVSRFFRLPAIRRSLHLLAAAAILVPTVHVSSALSQTAVIEGRDKWLFPGWESHDKVDHAGIAQSIALIKDVKNDLAARKIELLLVVAPMKAPFYTDKLQETQKLSAEVTARYAGLTVALKEAGLQSVDVPSILKTNLKDKQSAFFRTDYHWTAWAAEAAAAATARAIKDSWKLRGEPGGGTVLGEWSNERRFGDLAANFMTEEQQKAVGREVFTVRRAAANGGKGLVDEDAALIHVVGNSFVQPYLGFPQALSNALDRPVSLTWNPGNVGPWSTFLQYVESKDFKSNPPQVIVWQFNEAQMHQGPDAKGQWEPKSTMAADTWRSRVHAAIGP